MKHSIHVFVTSIFLLSISSQAQVNWTDAAGGNWTNDASWSTGTAPTAADIAQHTSVGATISVTTAAAANQLNVSHLNTAIVNVGSGGSLAVGGNSEIGNVGAVGSVGKLVVDGGSVSIGGNIDYGKFGTRHGMGELNSGSMTVNGITTLGGWNADAQGTMTINEGTYTGTGGIFQIGRTGNGTLNMNGGMLQLQEDTGVVWNALRVGISSGNGTVNLYGGEIHTGGLIMEQGAVDAGTGTINLIGGLLQVEGAFGSAISMLDDAQMVFDGGVFKWAGDRNANFDTLVSGGFISWDTASTAMQTESWDMAWTNAAQTSVLYADYNDASAGYTTVWAAAIPEPATLGMISLFGGSMLFVRRLMM